MGVFYIFYQQYVTSLAGLDMGNTEVKNPNEVVPFVFSDHHITLSDGTAFDLSAPDVFTITPVQEGLNRVRFMAWSPDKRLFVTDMHDLSDNTRGKVYVFANFNPTTKKFATM